MKTSWIDYEKMRPAPNQPILYESVRVFKPHVIYSGGLYRRQDFCNSCNKYEYDQNYPARHNESDLLRITRESYGHEVSFFGITCYDNENKNHLKQYHIVDQQRKPDDKWYIHPNNLICDISYKDIKRWIPIEALKELSKLDWVNE